MTLTVVSDRNQQNSSTFICSGVRAFVVCVCACVCVDDGGGVSGVVRGLNVSAGGASGQGRGRGHRAEVNNRGHTNR